MIQVIHRAFDILEYIAKEPGKAKLLSEIAGDLKLNPGTCANILKTMADRNYVRRLDKQKGYVLGSMTEGFTGYESHTSKLISIAKPELEKITSKLNENTVLGILKNDLRRALLHSSGSHNLQASVTVEKRAYGTATGRMLIALLTDEELDAFTADYGLPTREEWPEATDKKSFLKHIQIIRTHGHVVHITGQQIIGFAVPIRSQEQVIASLSVYMPLPRYSDNEDELVKIITEAAKRISGKMD